MSAPTRLAILGATGSIGRQALEVVAAHPDRLRVTAIARGRTDAQRDDELETLAAQVGAGRVCVEARDGTDALLEMVTARDVDLVLVATPGVAGLRPTLAALGAGKSVALANKEVLVVGGHLVSALAGGAGERLRPVDSEHAALWQCLAGVRRDDVARVLLTASGGPFRELSRDELAGVTPEHALRHPTWRMGPKVTVDSATLVNKAYEVIETHWLYGLPYERIDVQLHPESVIHALVELVDGSVNAQLAEPDMRMPIQYALLWEHAPSPARRMDWTTARSLRLGPVDAARYPCFAVALEVARSGDLRALVGLSAADELAVEAFLAGAIPFTGIAEILRRGAEMTSRSPRPPVRSQAPLPLAPESLSAPSLDEIVELDRQVRETLSPELAPATMH